MSLFASNRRALVHRAGQVVCTRNRALWLQVSLCIVLALFAVRLAACPGTSHSTAARVLQQLEQGSNAAAGRDTITTAAKAEATTAVAADVPYTDPDNDPRTNPLRFAVLPTPLPETLPAGSRLRRTVVVPQEDTDTESRCATVATAADKEDRWREERKVARLISSASTGRARGSAAPIEVFFHSLVYLDEGIVSRSQVQKQLDVLNAAFDKLRVRFILRQAFMYNLGTEESGKSFYNAAYGSQEEQMFKKAWRKGDARTLNIYTLNMSQGVLGWSTFPWRYDSSRCDNCRIMDGVVLNVGAMPFGQKERFNTGNTAVHEVGHWLGLFHTFEGGCDGNATTGGDLVADTPAQKLASSGCPIGQDSCPNLPGPDAVTNYMDYSDDTCMTNFTAGQFRRMAVMWRLHRG